MRTLVSTLALTALAGCAATATEPRGSLPSGARYVALGSSFASGASIPPLATDRPERCEASQRSYSRLLAADLGFALSDASCSGATTAHVTAPWNELPAQIDAVTADTRLVTITMGGNDLNYMGVLFAASCHAGVWRDRLADRTTGECRPVFAPSEEAYRAAEDNLAALLAAIRSRAPQARVVLVQYPALVPDEPCAAAPLAPEHAALARSLARGLAVTSERAAARADAEVLPIDRLSLGHTACDGEPWTHGLSESYDQAMGDPWHPSAAGHAAIARALAGLLAQFPLAAR